MPSSTLAGIITAIGTMLTAVALVINAITERRRSRRVESKVDVVHRVGQENHDMLNSEKKDRMNYQRALIRFIQEKGMDPPIDQSVDDK